MIIISIVDDDINICKQLKQILLEYSNNNCLQFEINIFNEAEDFIKTLNNNVGYDILFLDIEIDKDFGIDIGKKIRYTYNNYLTKIIYISSHTQYALSAYESMPTDFLPKPLNKDMVIKSIDNVLKTLNISKGEFIYNANGKLNRVVLANVLYFESYRNTIKIHTVDDRIDIFYSTLKEVSNNINNKNFFQQHKSYIVNIEYITKIEKNEVTLLNNQKIPVSRDKVKYLKEFLMNYGRN